jgi:hypothetical protein
MSNSFSNIEWTKPIWKADGYLSYSLNFLAGTMFNKTARLSSFLESKALFLALASINNLDLHTVVLSAFSRITVFFSNSS